ncbi:hypothetical protein SAMN05421835_15311, partial [Amycolatopsis sacchari]
MPDLTSKEASPKKKNASPAGNTAKLGGLGEESDAWWLGVCGGVVVGFFGFV